MNFSQLKALYQKYNFHILVWSIYIVYEVFILGLISDYFREPGIYFIVYSSNISSFYLYAFLFNKSLNSESKAFKILRALSIVLLIILLYVILSCVLFILFAKGHIITSDEKRVINTGFILSCIYRSLLYIGFATGYVYINRSFKNQKKVEALERQSLVMQIEKQGLENDLIQSQNNFLRSQINPHFLFNTLNFIYNDARKKAPMAADAIMNLAEMMRYALKRPEAAEMVPLSEEVEQIQHLINLHKLRTANGINLQLDVASDLFGLRFPPLILLTLVENIFKHGNVSHSTQPATIKIFYNDGKLNIITTNMINDAAGAKKESHNLGIDNINKRLKNFYEDGFVFKYYKDPLNRFITEIEVKVVNPMANLNN